jgi:ribosomal protein S18 acetylase RimI-like enzyme
MLVDLFVTLVKIEIVPARSRLNRNYGKDSMNTTIAPASTTTIKPILGKYYIREMIPDHYSLVVNIEKSSRETFWNLHDFRQITQEDGNQGRIITFKRHIIGHYMFQITDESINLLNFTLMPEFRRQKIGTTVLNVLKRDWQIPITCHIRESNTAAHLFLRSNKFQAQKVERSYFADYDLEDHPRYEDAYYFTSEVL